MIEVKNVKKEFYKLDKKRLKNNFFAVNDISLEA